MDIKIYTYDQIDSDLRNCWLELWERSRDRHPFNHPAWVKVAPLPGKGLRKQIIVGCKENRYSLFLIAAVGGKKMTLLGSPYLDKASILADQSMSRDDWKKIVADLLDDYDQITLQELPHSLIREIEFNPVKGRSMTRSSSLSPFFEVENPLISGKRRHEARRYTRKLEKDHGPLEISFSLLTPQLLRVMADIESRSAKPARGRAEFENKDYFNFLKRAIDEFTDMCWIGLMSLNGKPIAHYAGIIYGENIIGLHMAFDMEFSRYSPGTVLIFNMLPILREKNIKLFEFGRGQSVVKSRFAGDQAEEQHTAYFFRKSARGTLGFIKTSFVWECISLARRIRARDLKGVNRFLDRLALKR